MTECLAMRVDLLCSGSKGNACLVRHNNTEILIDCGPPSWRYLKNAMDDAGVSPDDLDALLITHSHSDHIRQLSHFTGLPVYACCALHPKNYKKQPVTLDLRQVLPPVRFQVGDLKILALPTSHDSGPSMGFVIESEHEKLVYMTDTGYVPEALFGDLSDADYYIFESNHDLEKLNQTDRPFALKMRIASDTGHLCNQDSARILCSCMTRRTRHIVLAHLSEEANTPELALGALFERLEYAHVHHDQLVIEAAKQFEPLHFGEIREDDEAADETAAAYSAYSADLSDLTDPADKAKNMDSTSFPDRKEDASPAALPAPQKAASKRSRSKAALAGHGESSHAA